MTVAWHGNEVRERWEERGEGRGQGEESNQHGKAEQSQLSYAARRPCRRVTQVARSLGAG